MDDHGRGYGPRPPGGADEEPPEPDPLGPDPLGPELLEQDLLGPELLGPAPLDQGTPDPPPPPPPPPPYDYEGVWRFTAPAVDASVPQARHAVRDLLYRQGVPASQDLVHGLLLIVSELVTNAVRHAALLSPMLAVEVAVGAEWVRVSVEDNHPYRPTALEAAHSETGGRGLLLVREVTREAGGACDVEHTSGGGKVIWAALPLSTVRVS